MDATNAQTSFVEIAFGINTFFALYGQFRDYLHINVDRKVREYEATTKTIEPKEGEVKRLNTIKAIVSRYARQHIRMQQTCVRIATALSVVAAVICVGILYWDVIVGIGHWTGCLILPLPVYFGVSLINYGVFRGRSAWILRRFRQFIKEFEPPDLPSD